MANPVLQLRVPAELRLDAAPVPSNASVDSAPPSEATVAWLLEGHREMLTRFVRRHVAACDVDDVVQETFARAFVALPEFRSDAKLSTWLLAIARNVCADHHRRAGRCREEHPASSAGASGRFTAPMERLADADAPRADVMAMEAEVRARVLAEVDDLPEHLRRVFVLRVLDGLRFPEIAEVVGEGVPTVKSRMRYAVESLRGSVADLQTWLTGRMVALEA